MAGPKPHYSAANNHDDSSVERLRAAMGVHTPFDMVEVNGVKVAWQEVKSALFNRNKSPADTLVCLHDVCSGSREYRPLIDRVPHGARLVLIDWPGHGKSGNGSVTPSQSGATSSGMSVVDCDQLLERTLRELGIERPILLGSGFGGGVAIHYAAARSGRVSGLVLCHPSGLWSSINQARWARTKVRPLDVIQTLAQCRRKSASTSPRSDDPTSARESRRQALRTALLQVKGAKTLHETEDLLSKSKSSLLTAVSTITCPVYFAVSQESGQFPAENYIALLDRLLLAATDSLPRHTLTEFAGGFHPVWDEPIRFAQSLNGFVQSLRPVQSHQHAWLLSQVDWPVRETNLWRCVHPECNKEIAATASANPNDQGVVPN